MSSFSFAKLKSYLPGHNNSNDGTNKRHSISLEPEIGFQLTLEPGGNNCGTKSGNTGNKGAATSSGNIKKSNINEQHSHVPTLNVHLISARHLPSLFGFKTVQGYQIKVKLFPGSTRYDSTIQTCTWPKFDEIFKFPLEPDIKPSIKNYAKDKNSSDNLPEKLCSGHFVVFTVYALLELPPGTFNRFKGTYRSLREKGNNLLKGKSSSESGSNNDNNKKNNKENKQDTTNSKIQQQLTHSESRRNIGSVTCFLDSKIFKYNQKSGQYFSDELWLPVKDISITPSNNKTSSTLVNNVANSTKGQIELILEISDSLKQESFQTNEETSSSSSKQNSVQNDENKKNKSTTSHPLMKKQWSINEMKRKMIRKSSKCQQELYLKVTTSKMRCSIKAKDEFENIAGQIYVKTTVFEHNILSNSWKCDNFLPSLSTRWDPKQSTIIVPILNDDETLKNISIKTTVATKTKVGKKIILGTVLIGPQITSGSGLEHWKTLIGTRNEPIAQWHNFK